MSQHFWWGIISAGRTNGAWQYWLSYTSSMFEDTVGVICMASLCLSVGKVEGKMLLFVLGKCLRTSGIA